MPKNIVLCSDGTGNKGGSGSDTNVFKIYNAVRINNIPQGERQQIVFYDNGVGTSKSKLGRALGGGLGMGFRHNVRDLYEFLGRHYDDEDHVYIFGFSRGAATVRAFAGMLECCGLVVKEPGKEQPFQDRIDAAMDHYVASGGNASIMGMLKALRGLVSPAPPFKKGRKVKIEFMGIWDTVSALGTPQVPPLDAVLNILRRHKFYDYEPETCVKHVYHAMAVDDARGTFWPKVWNEEEFNRNGGTIEQVWFAGMHTNVGGGYPRNEVANVTLDWMMHKLDQHRASLQSLNPPGGLSLKQPAQRDAENDANPHGKVYDSRSGLMIYYRYQPRPIKTLCDKAKTPIRIHTSVLDRLEMRTAGYTPGNLPAPLDFEEVATRRPAPVDPPPAPTAEQNRNYERVITKLDRLKNSRIALYWTFLFSTLALLIASGVAWLNHPELEPPDCCSPADMAAHEAWRVASTLNWWLAHLEDSLRWVLPTFFDNAITYLVVEHPERLLLLVLYALALLGLRMGLQGAMVRLEDDARLEMLIAMGRTP